MKILLIRSAPLDQSKTALRKLIEEFPEGDISVLTHVTTTGDILDVHPVRIFNYDAKYISLFSIGAQTWKILRQYEFEKVVIVCRNHLGDGYDFIKLFALSLGTKNIELWNVSGEKFDISWVPFIFGFFFQKCLFIVYFFIWCSFIVRDILKGRRVWFQNLRQRLPLKDRNADRD
ncbi:hypothetical protein ACFL3D_03750 [Candidatus Omnitrophota bacterium]